MSQQQVKEMFLIQKETFLIAWKHQMQRKKTA